MINLRLISTSWNPRYKNWRRNIKPNKPRISRRQLSSRQNWSTSGHSISSSINQSRTSPATHSYLRPRSTKTVIMQPKQSLSSPLPPWHVAIACERMLVWLHTRRQNCLNLGYASLRFSSKSGMRHSMRRVSKLNNCRTNSWRQSLSIRRSSRAAKMSRLL